MSVCRPGTAGVCSSEAAPVEERVDLTRRGTKQRRGGTEVVRAYRIPVAPPPIAQPGNVEGPHGTVDPGEQRVAIAISQCGTCGFGAGA